MLSLISQWSALFGFFGLAICLLLAVRSRHLDKFFGGLGHLYQIHHRVARLAALLILIHAFVEIYTFGWSVEVLKLYVSDWGLLSGCLSVLGLGILFAFAKKLHLGHRIWRFIHFVSVPVWIGICVHVYIFMGEGFTAYLLWFSFLVGTGSLIRSQIFPRLDFWGFRFQVKSLKKLNHQVMEIRLEPLKPNAPKATETAQYFYLRFHSSESTRDWHPFTCISRPGEKDLCFAIKALGRDTRVVRGMSEKMRVDVEGPFGHLHPTQLKNEVWIVGGVGITPLVSVAREASFAKFPVRVLHAVDTPQDQIYPELWNELQTTNAMLSYRLWNTKSEGFVTQEIIGELLKGAEDSNVYVAGPEPFIKHVRNLLEFFQIPSTNIFTEEFIRL